MLPHAVQVCNIQNQIDVLSGVGTYCSSWTRDSTPDRGWRHNSRTPVSGRSTGSHRRALPRPRSGALSVCCLHHSSEYTGSRVTTERRPDSCPRCTPPPPPRRPHSCSPPDSPSPASWFLRHSSDCTGSTRSKIRSKDRSAGYIPPSPPHCPHTCWCPPCSIKISTK